MKLIGILMLFMMCLVAPTSASARTPAKFETLFHVLTTNPQYEISQDIANEAVDAQHQILCLALNIYHEARGSSNRDQWAVGFVTLNRVKTGVWGTEICDVVEATNLVRGKRVSQFTWTQRPVKANLPHEEDSWQDAQHKAMVLYEGDKSDFTNGATHFYLASLNPDWARRGRGKIRIGDHIYLRMPKLYP